MFWRRKRGPARVPSEVNDGAFKPGGITWVDGKAPKYWEGPYRDPLPGEDVPDDPLLRFLPPDRQAYWRQVREWHTPNGVCLVSRLSNTAADILRTEAKGQFVFRLAEALEKLEKKLG